MGWLTDDERRMLAPAERALPRLPIPVQAVSSDEFITSAILKYRFQAGGAV